MDGRGQRGPYYLCSPSFTRALPKEQVLSPHFLELSSNVRFRLWFGSSMTKWLSCPIEVQDGADSTILPLLPQKSPPSRRFLDAQPSESCWFPFPCRQNNQSHDSVAQQVLSNCWKGRRNSWQIGGVRKSIPKCHVIHWQAHRGISTEWERISFLKKGPR